MTDLVEIEPLVVVCEHGSGIWSAFPAFEPKLVTHAPDRESVINDLRLFLGDYLPKLDAEQVRQLLVPEAAVLEKVELELFAGKARHKRRLKSALCLDAIVLSARAGARWVLVPAIGHVAYVPPDRLATLAEAVAKDVRRLVLASDADGPRLLELLPPLESSILRLPVALSAESSTSLESKRQKAAAQRRDHARKLLSSVGRLVQDRVVHAQHRDAITLTVRTLLDGPSRVGVVLVGPEGAGKSQIMRAVACRTGPLNREVYVTSGAELVAGQSFVGQLEERIENIMRAVELLDAVLYFEGLEDLFTGRQGGYQDLAELMRRFVAEGRVRIAGELTSERYDALQHRYVGFFSQLHKVNVEPLSVAQTEELLIQRAESARKRNHPALTRAAIPVLLDLVERYEPYRAQPGKALRFVDELSTLRENSVADSNDIAPDDVYRAFAVRTGVPDFMLRDERGLVLSDVVRFFEQRLIGQREAVRNVAETLCRIKARLSPSGKPLATFLFVGPTGVGKTELAKALACYLFGSSERLARFDMSEYTDALAAERLIRGSEGRDGVLTRRIREQPFTVVLLDEIEKADASVFDLLLQVFGEARLSDAQGKVAHFNNAIIIMTSNLGAQHLREAPGFGERALQAKEHYVQQAQQHFRPEFINRLDRIIAFDSLSEREIAEVCAIAIRSVALREGFDVDNILLWVSNGALERLANGGYSAAYGARGLRRYLEQALVAPIAGVIARLGSDVRGSLIAVISDDEPLLTDPRALAEAVQVPELGTRLASEQFQGLTALVYRRPQKLQADVNVIVAIGRMRREVLRWDELNPLSEIRERLKEIQGELGSAEQWRKRRGPVGQTLSDLTTEQARLAALTAPLDAARRELEDTEGLVIGALSSGESPEMFRSDAERAYQQYRANLIRALLGRSDEKETALVIHELDERRVLHEFLLPVLEYVKAKGWDAWLHVDRAPGEKRAKDQVWGTALSIGDYCKEFVGEDKERPFSNVLLRVRGHAAGALLSFCVGRFRYHGPKHYGELWVRLAARRFTMVNDDQTRHEFTPVIDTAVGRRQTPLFVSNGSELTLSAERELELFACTRQELFKRWEEIIFKNLVATVERGER